MKRHEVDLASLEVRGKTRITREDGYIEAITECSVTGLGFHLAGDNYKRHYFSVPGKYKLPFKIEATVRLDHPALFLFVGGGYVTFASGHEGQMIGDFLPSSTRPAYALRHFENGLPPGEFVEISIIYNLDSMQITVGGEERFYSEKQNYMKKNNRAKLGELNGDGFDIRFTVSKLSTLAVKKITVTEYDDAVPITRGGYVEAEPPEKSPAKPTFESVLDKIPERFKNEIFQIDAFLKSLSPMKFKRSVDKGGSKITYVAPNAGISYAVIAAGEGSFHHFGWYIVFGGPVETWHRVADFMEETLAEISKADPKLADRLFFALTDCCNCYPHGLCKTFYAFGGTKRLSCHGRAVLRMREEDFADLREFFRHLNALLKRKTDEGKIPAEKIYLVKK